MSSPSRDSGAMSRQIQRQMPGAAAGGAVIGLYLINLASLYLVNILNYAFSHPSRMYEVGHRFWGLLALIAFVQGAFLVGGPVLVHPTLMFLLLGIVLVMSLQMNVIEELRTIRHDKTEEHYNILIKGLEGEIALVTVLLWGCVALAFWWSPDTAAVFKWLGLGGLSANAREYWYFWTVIFFFQILVGNYGLKFLITMRIQNHMSEMRKLLKSSGDKYSDEQRKQIDKAFTAKAVLMKSDLRAASRQTGNFYVLFGTSLVTGLYWLVIWYFHNYQINWSVL